MTALWMSGFSFALGGAAMADTGSVPCADYGTISPAAVTVNPGDGPVSFRVVGGAGCGDLSQCSWVVEDGRGTLSAESGSPVNWAPPATLDQCLPVSFRIWVSCPGVDTGESTVDLRCTDDQLADLVGSRDMTLSGGGCTGPKFAFVLAPPVLLFGGARRRRKA